MSLLVPYLKIGLKSDEACLWVIADPLSLDDAKSTLHRALPDLDAHLTSGQVDIVDHDLSIARLIAKEEIAVSRGYKGLRVAWFAEDFGGDDHDAHKPLKEAIDGHQIVCACVYWLSCARARNVLDVMQLHDFAVARQGPRWEIVGGISRNAVHDEEALRASEERLRLALDSAKMGTWEYSPRTGELIWDSRSKALWGLPPDAEITEALATAGIHPEDRERAAAAAEEALKSEIHDREYRSEFRLTAILDGVERWIAVLGKIVKDEAGQLRRVGVMRDITPEHQLAEALHESEERLRLALQSAQIGIWEYFPQTDKLIWDDRVKALWGLAADAKLLPEMRLTGIHPDDAERAAEAAKRCRDEKTGGIYEVEHRTIGLQDGVERWVAVHGRMFFDDKRRPLRSLGVVRDITAQRHAEEVRERLVGIFAHDLRSPLWAISMACQVLVARGDVPEDILKTVRVISRSADRMGRMIQQLMDFTRVRLGGDFPLARERVDLAAICRNAAEEATMANPGRNVRCVAPQECFGTWDPTSLVRVIGNLLGNAIHHGAPERPIEIVLHEDGADAVVLEVHNWGEPIPKDLLPVIFDPFRRGKLGQPRDTTTGAEGLGLGLYIVAQIVARHGGRLALRSTAGEGTTFTVRLPREIPTADV